MPIDTTKLHHKCIPKAQLHWSYFSNRSAILARSPASLNLVGDWAAHPVYDHSRSWLCMPPKQTDAFLIFFFFSAWMANECTHYENGGDDTDNVDDDDGGESDYANTGDDYYQKAVKKCQSNISFPPYTSKQRRWITAAVTSSRSWTSDEPDFVRGMHTASLQCTGRSHCSHSVRHKDNHRLILGIYSRTKLQTRWWAEQNSFHTTYTVHLLILTNKRAWIHRWF